MALSSCVRFQGDNLKVLDLSRVKIKSDQNRVITYTMTQSYLGDYEEGFVHKMKECGWDASHSMRPKPGIPHVDISLSIRKNPAAAIPEFITAFSFYLIPSWKKSRYTMKVGFSNADNQDSNFLLKDSVTQALWLPMIFAYPFADPYSVEGRLIQKMYGHVAYKITRDYEVRNLLEQEGL